MCRIIKVDTGTYDVYLCLYACMHGLCMCLHACTVRYCVYACTVCVTSLKLTQCVVCTCVSMHGLCTYVSACMYCIFHVWKFLLHTFTVYACLLHALYVSACMHVPVRHAMNCYSSLCMVLEESSSLAVHCILSPFLVP